VKLGIQAGRFRYPPEGLFGGKAGQKATFLVNGAAANPYGLTQLKPGDRVTMDAAGGGGYGDPLERDPVLVAEDVQNGYVSLAQASEAYGVALDREGMKVDTGQTKRLRASRRGGNVNSPSRGREDCEK
jgi:N-methylhydantoinase B